MKVPSRTPAFSSKAGSRKAETNDRSGCAPCKGGAFQWVRIPPGKRSSRKQPEQRQQDYERTRAGVGAAGFASVTKTQIPYNNVYVKFGTYPH